MNLSQLIEEFVVPDGKRISLSKDFNPGFTPTGVDKNTAGELLKRALERLTRYQNKLYAQDRHALLVIFQAMDAAGKDGAIRHVMSGVNPHGVQVYSFRQPSSEELDHDYLWRCARVLPERGRIGIFNRSYYEEVLIVRVHKEVLAAEHLPDELKDSGIWSRRFDEINAFEKYLENNGIHVVKIFLNVSREEQRRRFLDRIQRPEKNWKFSLGDVRERSHWDAYMEAYEDCISRTSTKGAPWYVVPADHKWVTRLAVSAILNARLKTLRLDYPAVTEDQRRRLEEARQMLESESGGGQVS
jgi:PPK2 family polyphosphate:nucleotide phosphotransferase